MTVNWEAEFLNCVDVLKRAIRMKKWDADQAQRLEVELNALRRTFDVYALKKTGWASGVITLKGDDEDES